jgi:arylsulfatase A-like enzyme
MMNAKMQHAVLLTVSLYGCVACGARPNIVLVMTDDQGWGQTGYYNHPLLKTPKLDQMAANGLRFNRFYAGAPNCSPTRATVMTGRSNDRTGVLNHGYPLRKQEKTLPQALRQAGYATGHFGKWHLSGFRGPGVPILEDDERGPGPFGFDEWLSVTNFFDRDPLMSRKGKFEAFKGDSSEIIVAEALKFMGAQAKQERPFLTVIWYGTPHSPFRAAAQDMKGFSALDVKSKHHYGELVAMDRSVGTLRQGLRELSIAGNTLVWFCSDNGGLRGIQPDTVGGLRGNKNSVFEGGLRVPAIVEWPAQITQARVTEYPAATMDIFPTLAEIVGLPESVLLRPYDGMSICPLFRREIGPRPKPIPFRHTGRAAWVDNRYKLLTEDLKKDQFQLYDLVRDPQETTDISAKHPEIAAAMLKAFQAWNQQVEGSIAGLDYPEGHVVGGDVAPKQWATSEEYRPYLDLLKRGSR